ncbi:ubiquitin-like modifier-activating enzyme 7 isoform X5 [Apodemus sylvaticus]|nr:ubiquitin-like modifier-activating enzyme 7 isoform X5 [Apodemus sylvaticus]XP_052043278.1 ubiquitin-like modifier-activating enzyme 7 isoform X5 [Apodemus sylvaticus]
MAETRGLVGRVFCDFGEDFTVEDPTEVEPMTAAIQDISQGFPGIVTLRGGTKRHSFYDGDLVVFSDIEGMVELNSHSPQPVHVQKDGSLEIGDTTTFSRYLRGGVVTEIKRPKTVRHKPLDIALLQPRMVAQNSQEEQRAHCLHRAFHALHKFQQLHSRLPKPWDPDDAETVVGLAQDLEPLKGTEESLDETLLRTIALSSAGSLSPMAAILGGVAAQEVLKAVSRKFLPLDQWLYFDALECLPEDEKLLPLPEDCLPRNCRYDGQIAVFGTGLQEKLSHQRYLLQVGAGAIGCEMLKGLALVGLGLRAHGGVVTVADMDHIERSNLSRQFLFRPEDVGRPKAEVAAAAARHLNPDLQVTSQTHPLDPTTEDIYDDSFFSRVDGVVAALDSFQARHYVAARCTHYLKPLLEAGTQGTRGSASVFVPYVTEAYRGPASAASEDAPYPVCTVRHFPSTVEHSLQWAQNEFEELFRQSAETINRYQQTGTSLLDTDRTGTLDLLKQVMGVLRTRPQTWRDCVVWALGHWQLCFRDSIVELLRNFPSDKVLEDGTLFWSGSKMCPQPLQFDPNQDMHFLYVLAAANLYARMHGLLGSQSQPALRKLLKQLLESDSTPQNLFSAELGQEQLKELQETLDDWRKGPPLKPVMFGKDDDSDFIKVHVNFVVAATDLRCQNYGVRPVNHDRIKQIMGRIVPAIVTSTAVVAGLLGLELYKVVSGPRPRGTFRHSYLHLAENYFIRSEPSVPAIQSFHHLEWTCWDCLKVSAGQPEKTLESLLAHLQEEYGLKVEILLYDQALLYSSEWPYEKRAQRLCLRVTELVQQVTGWKPKPGLRVLVLELSCEGEEDEDETAFPPLHYEL